MEVAHHAYGGRQQPQPYGLVLGSGGVGTYELTHGQAQRLARWLAGRQLPRMGSKTEREPSQVCAA
ncbi:hypothetical protein C1H46_024863 [Malus baccata]|uniref:Uncharacterized protein n=1 Tax=Malus baccata TaxID=106549 RepID=A0A540LT36_MALBA|nr:hypothetical protein C1H46_024863 [Malus baccata]